MNLFNCYGDVVVDGIYFSVIDSLGCWFFMMFGIFV